MIWFRVGTEINLVFVCEIEIDLVLVWVSKLTSFCAGVEIDLVFVCGPKITWF